MPKRVPSHDSPAELPNAELEILAHLWQQGPRTSRQILDGLAGRRPMAHGSMLSLLGRLEKKGLVARRKGPGDKAYIYSPTRRPESTYRRLARDMVERLFGGSSAKLVLSLFEGRKPSPREIEQVRCILDELERKARE